MDFEINTLQKKDVDEFETTYLKALENNWPTLEGPKNNNKKDWERNFRDWIRNDFTILLLRIDNEIRGYIAGDPSRILHLWVHKDYRGNSFGKALINEFLKIQSRYNFFEFRFKAYKENIDYFKKLDCKLTSEADNFAIFKFNKYG